MKRYLQKMVAQNVAPLRDNSVVITERDPPPIVGKKMPADYVVGPEALVNNYLPPWNVPGFRARPIDVEGPFTPVDFYETPYLLLAGTTPEGFLGIITGISYEVTCMTQYDFFVFYVYRNGDLLSKWEDCLINPAAPNPAYRFAECGHIRTLPFYGRFDGGETITIKVVARGLEPFTHTPADPVLCGARVCITGFQSELDGTREGKARLAQGGALLEFPAQYANADLDNMRNLPAQIPRPARGL